MPNSTGVRPETFCARITARSELGSRPTIDAGAVVPSWNTAVTVPASAASSTTWLLVSSRPSELRTIAEPSPDEAGPSTRSCTTLGSTRAATASTGVVGAAASSTSGSG